jgi:cyclophilin family peptidyl-prolyl cis-trans isomerase
MTIAPIVTNPISDLIVESNAPGTTYNLLSHFDDPSTTGKIAQFQLYNPTLGNGAINVLLFDQAGVGAPLTVQNFINYTNGGDYINSIIHRSVTNFVVQGGGFTVNQLNIASVPTDPPVQNEFSATRSNLRGTIAMAKQGGNPNSATSQWFFNLGNNSANLDNQNGGFTVFGEVLSTADLATIDAIAAVPVFNGSGLNPAFSEIPLQIAQNNPQIDDDNDYVRFSNIAVSQLNELQFSVIGNTNPSLVNVTVNGLALQVDYLPDRIGTATITIQATTLLGEQITDTFTLTVFDPAQYGASHIDLIQVYGYNLDAFEQHYLAAGKLEGRSVDTFDEKSYLASHDDLLNAFGTDLEAATEHYIRTVLSEGRPITFNATQYLASHDDLIMAFGNNPETAKDHFIQTYATEKRARDTFKEDIYLASHPDLIDAFGNNLEAATQHYINAGAAEKRPKEVFSPVSYINNYPDLKTAFGDNLAAATLHYITTGYPDENRPWF